MNKPIFGSDSDNAQESTETKSPDSTVNTQDAKAADVSKESKVTKDTDDTQATKAAPETNTKIDKSQDNKFNSDQTAKIDKALKDKDQDDLAANAFSYIPDKAIYMIGAVDVNANPKVAKLEETLLLGEHPDQLKYTYAPVDADKHKPGDAYKLILKQDLGYVLIDSNRNWYQFIYSFLNDPKNIKQGKLPRKLSKWFMVYLTKDEAQKRADELTNLQQSYFNALVNSDKLKAPMKKIFVVDLQAGLLDYAARHILPEITNEPEFKKRLEQQKINLHI